MSMNIFVKLRLGVFGVLSSIIICSAVPLFSCRSRVCFLFAGGCDSCDSRWRFWPGVWGVLCFESEDEDEDEEEDSDKRVIHGLCSRSFVAVGLSLEAVVG